MDAWWSKARAFAEETAKRSQELASQTAKYSEQLAKDAAKKSMELAEKSKVLAEEAAKKADSSYKALVKDFTGVSVAPVKKKPVLTEEELEEYGITEEFRDFVKGLTMKTFRDFPLEEMEKKDANQALEEGRETTTEDKKPDTNVRKDLTEFQERHATLVLLSVPEISDFRYLLCPRRMTERSFWKIYFTVVRTHLAPYEARAAEKKAAKEKADQEAADVAAAAEAQKTRKEQELSTSAQATAATQGAPAGKAGPSPSPETPGKKDSDNEHDLDAYLMGALGPEDGGEDDDEGDFDPEDFDKYVNDGALDGLLEGDGAQKKGAPKSELSSDGELVEAPSPESEQDTKHL